MARLGKGIEVNNPWRRAMARLGKGIEVNNPWRRAMARLGKMLIILDKDLNKSHNLFVNNL